jgi:hypothetical protein
VSNFIDSGPRGPPFQERNESQNKME